MCTHGDARRVALTVALGLVGCAGAPAPPPERIDDVRRPAPTRREPAPEAAVAEDPIWVGPMPSDDVRRAALMELEELYLETVMTDWYRALSVTQLRARFETLGNAAARLGVPTMERVARSRHARHLTEGPSWVEANTPELAPDAPNVTLAVALQFSLDTVLRALDSAGEPMRGEVACLLAKGRTARAIDTFTRQDVLAGIERLDEATRTLVPRAALRSALRIADRADEALGRFDRRLQRLHWRYGVVAALLQELREELAQITTRHRGYGFPSLRGHVSMNTSVHYGRQIVARHRETLERWRRFQREAPDLLPEDRARLVELAEVVGDLEPGMRRWDDQSIAAALRIDALVASLSEWTGNPLRWGPSAALEEARAACGALFAR